MSDDTSSTERAPLRHRKFRTQVYIMAAIQSLEKEFPMAPGVTKKAVQDRIVKMGNQPPALTTILRHLKRLWHEGELEGFEAVWQTNADGTEIKAYYWHTPGHSPPKQTEMFPDELWDE